MPTGISGSNTGPNVDGLPADDFLVVETRVLSNLINNLLGSNQAIESLALQRQAQAFELGINLPPPVNG